MVDSNRKMEGKREGKVGKSIKISCEINMKKKKNRICWKWVDDIIANLSQQEYGNNKY